MKIYFDQHMEKLRKLNLTMPTLGLFSILKLTETLGDNVAEEMEVDSGDEEDEVTEVINS